MGLSQPAHTLGTSGIPELTVAPTGWAGRLQPPFLRLWEKVTLEQVLLPELGC